MVFSSVPRSLLLLSLAAQALTASDSFKPSVTYYSFSTVIIPRATGLDSTMLGPNSTPTISSLPTTLTTIEPIAMPTMTPKPKGPQANKRCWFICDDNRMGTTSSATSAPLTNLHVRDAVATPTPGSMDQREHVDVDQDMVAVESIAERSVPFDRRNHRLNLRSEPKPEQNDGAKRDLGGDIEQHVGEYAEDHGFHISKRESFKQWLKSIFSGGHRDNGMN